MMTIKGRIAVRPSAVCSLCGCTMTKFPEANHWSDLSNIRIEALYFGQAFQERHSKRAQLCLRKKTISDPWTTLGLKCVVNTSVYFDIFAESSTAGIRETRNSNRPSRIAVFPFG